MNKLALPFAFGLIGYFFTSKLWLFFINSFNPTIGLIIYYIIITFVVKILECYHLIISSKQIVYNSQTIGIILIFYAYWILLSWQSCYLTEIQGKTCESQNLSNIYLQSEDGALYYFFNHFTNNMEISRWLTYVVTPMILAGIGFYLVK